MKTSKNIMWFIIVATVLACIGVYFTDVGGSWHDTILNILFLIPPLAAVIGGFNAVSAYGSENMHGRSLLFITLGLLAWFAGEAIWAIYELVLRINPYPSLADAFYLAAYPLIFIGIIQEIRNYKTDISPMRSMIISGVSIVLSIVVFNISILPAYSNASSFLENAIAVSYGIGDVVLIVGVSYLLMLTVDFSGGALFFSWLYVMVGVVFMLLGDLMFALYRTQYEMAIPFYKRIDFFWIFSYIFFAYGLFEMKYMIKDIQNRIRQLL